ncbi:RNA polymerase sigma factor [Chitinophaga nivalis]|uniref:RNA polymerase sigma-70 factor n=1 Tax=Chitinophaga nivalis TaxID=2991709 RepID=A0ABT3IFJ0_9BACT|nr:RNA polymerase sigma-70 factor [Chitinophaga nivalis]MCW3467593.1 RNA polymerase sigma-70 factor [Chitinophaga nivalis]MCW3482715.1 RNA polymerase sigma-70 factor [Chitinophaga nivalis]
MWQQAQQGDTTAFELLYKATVPLLSKQAYRILQDQEQTKDVIQDVFISLFLKRKTLPANTNITGYLSNAVKYKVSNILRNKLVQEGHHQELLKQAHQREATPPQTLEQHELKKQIAHSINTLPQKCREVFMLNYYGNLPYKDIAQEMGISVKTVEKHMSKALQVLRKELKETYYPGVFLLLMSMHHHL